MRTAIQPTSTGLELAPVLRGFTRRFLAYTFPSRLPDPRHPMVLTRPVVVRAALALPGASRIRLPPASARPLRRPGDGGLSPPHGHTGASWRTYSNRHGRSPSFAELVALEGTYVRCHLHQRRDTTNPHPLRRCADKPRLRWPHARRGRAVRRVPRAGPDLLFTIWGQGGQWRSVPEASRPMPGGCGRVGAVPLLHIAAAQHSPTTPSRRASLVCPSMRTPGAEVVRGRWRRSAIGGSLVESLAVVEVAVFECCTASGSGCWAGSKHHYSPRRGHD